MITVLVEYGSALYWALLFFGIYIITVFAEQRTDTIRPNIWAGILITFLAGFTNWHPDPVTLVMGIGAYLAIGASVATFKWVDLVGRIRTFTESMQTVVEDEYTLRCLAQDEFKPNDSRNGCMVIPPDPFEFRTRLWLWFVYWPSFTFLRPLTNIHKFVALAVWNLLCNLSKEIYDSRNYK